MPSHAAPPPNVSNAQKMRFAKFSETAPTRHRWGGVRHAEEVQAVTMPKRRATVAKSKWLEGR